jgi:hypothetical protein
VISNRLKQPDTDRVLISNRLYELVTDRFNLCNRLNLTSVTKNSCNGCLRRPLLEVYIGNRCCRVQPQGRPAALIYNGRQTTTVIDGVHVTGVKGPLQMMHDLFEVFT